MLVDVIKLIIVAMATFVIKTISKEVNMLNLKSMSLVNRAVYLRLITVDILMMNPTSQFLSSVGGVHYLYFKQIFESVFDNQADVNSLTKTLVECVSDSKNLIAAKHRQELKLKEKSIDTAIPLLYSKAPNTKLIDLYLTLHKCMLRLIKQIDNVEKGFGDGETLCLSKGKFFMASWKLGRDFPVDTRHVPLEYRILETLSVIYRAKKILCIYNDDSIYGDDGLHISVDRAHHLSMSLMCDSVRLRLLKSYCESPINVKELVSLIEEYDNYHLDVLPLKAVSERIKSIGFKLK